MSIFRNLTIVTALSLPIFATGCKASKNDREMVQRIGAIDDVIALYDKNNNGIIEPDEIDDKYKFAEIEKEKDSQGKMSKFYTAAASMKIHARQLRKELEPHRSQVDLEYNHLVEKSIINLQIRSELYTDLSTDIIDRLMSKTIKYKN